MKRNLLATATILLAASLTPAQGGTKDEVMSAIRKLSEKGNYSWVSTTQRPERPESAAGNNNRFRSGPTEGMTAGGLVYLRSSRGDRSSEYLFMGDKVATKGQDGWTVIEPRPSTDAAGADGQERSRRGGGRGSMLRNYKSPSVRAEELLASVGDLKKDGKVYTGELSEEGAKSLVNVWGGRSRGGDVAERPQPTGVKATAKFWLEDGVLTKYESVVAGSIKFGENERDLGRTTSVEIKEVGSTKIDAPADIMEKLSAGDKPAGEAKPAAK